MIKEATEKTRTAEFSFQRKESTFNAKLFTLETAPKTLLNEMFELLELNMRDLYQSSADFGWDRDAKIREFTEENARYLVVWTNEQLAGFLYFQFVMEDTADDDLAIPVIYCYELQIKSEFQGLGIGSALMDWMEMKGKEFKMQKAMLTVFKSNRNALLFYEKRGFKPDEISPSNYHDLEASYEIMSKSL